MKHTIRFIILIFTLVIAGAGNVWAISESDIIINIQPNEDAGTVTVSSISGMTVTISAVPVTGYCIDADHITVEKMVDAMAPRRAPGIASELEVTGSGNSFSFIIPEGYTGAYVTVNFYQDAPEGFTQITDLSQITVINGKYQLTADVSGVSSSLLEGGEFTGTLDGGLHKIIGSSKPLFASTNGAIIRNIIFEDVNISSGDDDGDAGAVTAKAKGATRIYNCGILPTSVERDDKGEITGFYGSSVGGSGNVGGLVGTLSGTARVINCFSYANITGGTNKGGIVGSNEETSTQASLTTMVMNCLFYGEISNGGNVSPIYGGTEINNVAGGLNNYNYYRYNSSYSKKKQINKYNRALAMEEKFITRFERYRLLLNSNKKLAAKYASTATVTVEPNDMAKWVLETADRSISGRDPYPYPILKAQGYYPSIINPDIKNAPDSASVGRNHGGKLGKTLTVHIAGVGSNAPDGASIRVQGAIQLQRTDKDFDRFNFNYDKVQLPYYNDYGTKNYTGNRVVTGWKITSITGGTTGTFTEADEWGGYNFADRNCTNKDLYSVSKRVFSQGAYWDVPKGVTAITIEPYWAVANYVSDEYYDVVYDASYSKKTYTVNGKQYNSGKIVVDGSEQTVYTNISSALAGFSTEGKTVYDQAVVLVGNVHQYANPTSTGTPYTVMSIDMDHDNEPDYSYIFTHDNRKPIDPIRYDFLNIMGIAEAQIPNGATLLRNVSIFNLKGWFEITNTCLVNFSQFEIENSKDSQNAVAKSPAPLILLGGTYEQIASTQKTPKPASTQYIHIGSNAWFAKFGNGTHSDGKGFTPHIPVSITGGDYDEFYLSGTYQPDITKMASDDAECYISGGRFGEMAGASMEAIWGDVRWDINWADITNFYGGGVNAVNPITGKIQVDITNSYVNQYCGGPKYGEMTDAKTVTTYATDCTFGTYFGAGYGGNAYKRIKYKDAQNTEPADHQGDYKNERGKYYDGETSSTSYGKKGRGVATDFDYEFFVWSTGGTGSRFYVNFVTFSLATTRGVTSNLLNCKVTGNVYGGGSLGKVDGDVSTTLKDCEVSGNVFGAGYSATLPKVGVRNTPAFIAGKGPSKNMNIGMFESGEINTTVEYEWKQVATSDLSNGGTGMVTENGKNYVYTDTNLSALGIVTGNVTLNIEGTTTVAGSVYGGGEESGVEGSTEVNVSGGTIGAQGLGGAEYGNVYGGGKGKRDNVTAGLVKGSTKVTISQTTAEKPTTVNHNVYGGGAYGSVGTFTYADNTYHTAHPEVPVGMPYECTSGGKTEVYITGGTLGWNGKENGMVFGSSRGDVGAPGSIEDKLAWVYDTHVAIGDTAANATITTATPLIKGSIYGGGENGHNLRNSYVRINGGTIGVLTGDNVVVTNADNSQTTYEAYNYPYRGNVYGGGCGTDKYYEDPISVTNPYDGKGNKYNPSAGIVKGNAFVNITGGYVVHNVYGAGAMGSVDAKTTVSVSGGRIGYDGSQNGHVFGAARGEYGTTTAASNLANVSQSEVNISYTTTPAGDDNNKTTQLIAGSVFGGGEAGVVKGSVAVNMTGGLILKDIYGGGALADTQTSNWDATANSNAGGWAAGKSSSSATTTIRLTGGIVGEEVFGGGLGEAGKPAYVYGDVLVDLNGTTAMSGGKPTENGTATTNTRGCAVGQIYGGNNVNGSPKGDVMVHVYATQNKNTNAIASKVPLTFTEPETDKVTYWSTQATNVGLTPATIIGEATADEAKINLLKAAIEAIRYDVKAVYGGGNQAAYVPETAYHPTNAPAGSKTQVIIEGCSTTSIETVYGGGNAAAVPETNVEIREAREILSVFGGGNGYSATDNHSDPSAPNYNPGADVGVYKEGNTEKTYGTGNANAVLKGGYIHEAYGGSNQKGKIKGKININTAPAGTCELNVEKLVGAGKNADVDGDLVMILGCKPTTRTPLVFAGADNADVNGNVELTITSGTFGKVFGGNNLGGVIKGHLVLNIEETGCNPIVIDELYLGGNEAAYSVYGYNTDGTCVTTGDKAYDADPVLNVVSCTSIGKVFGGGLGEGAKMYADPTVNINMIKGTATGSLTTLGTIGDVYGGGNAADVYGNTTVNIGTEMKVQLHESLQADGVTYNMSAEQDVLGANITGNVYGGGKKADVGQYDLANDHVDVTGNTYVNIGAKGTAILDNDNKPTGEYNYAVVNLTGINIGGNVFGGGEGEAAESGAGAFKCAKAIVTGGTNIHIGNGTVSGTVYGGGEVGRVEGNSVVAIGIGAGSTTPASAPIVLGDVFGAGKGKKTHGYSALLRGNTTVTIEGDAKVRGSVYGGGEIASVGKYNVKKGDNDPVGAPADVLVGMPYSLANSGSGYCTVIVQGNAEIGPESEMSMKKDGGPDNTGHVFGAGKGVLPYDGYGVTDDVWIADPWRVGIDDQKDIFNSSSTHGANYEKEYFKFIETLALATETNVTIDGNAFVKGSVYGGSQNGHVQHDTHVTIAGGQIGQGEGKTGRYSTVDWTSSSLAECPHWDFVESSGAPYDPLATTGGAYDYTNFGFVPTADRISDSKGGLPVAKDGHTYYGNVFGGGSGVSPYAPGKWHRGAGSVGGDTYVNITGGHILTSVYGGNEHTDVGTYEKDASGQPTTTPVANNARGKCTVNMTGGTVGVPRTDEEKLLHPVVGNVFGAGKGDQRIFFNTWTNVINTEVNISGDARIYGSVFGGGEDGHVISDAETNIGNVTIKTGKDANGDEITESASANGLIIGTQGTSYYDGHVFGGGRGFSGEAQTAGTVGGNVRLNINAGSVYGSVYGGGRLASVGTQFTTPDDDNYGNFVEDETGANGKKYGYVTVTISGGTIGNANATGDGAKYSGNVFGGSMGRLNMLDGTRSSLWPQMAQVKSTSVNIYGTAEVRRSVYGGGELGTVRDDAYVTIGGQKTADADANGNVTVETKTGTPTVRRDVYGGGYGSEDMTHTIFTVNEGGSNNTYAFMPMQFAGSVGKNTYVNVVGGYIRKNVYGGGEMASVGVIDYKAAEATSTPGADKVTIGPINGKTYYYLNVVKHSDATKEFALSWPYKFEYVTGYPGATHVNITGGRLGLKTGDTDSGFEDNGDVYGAGKGMAGDFNDYLFCANVGSTDVKIAYATTPTAYSGDIDCIAGAVYGGGEDGHVIGDTKLTISGGLINHSVYGAGSGKGKFSRKLLKSGKTYGSTTDSDYETRDAYSITAGKVFGNSTVEMSGGYVVRNVYGGGNMGSVGKGNYAGGAGDYSANGYGEKVTTDLWSNADFMNSGKCTVKISGGTIGYIDADPSNSMYPYNSSASLPYGNVFGGCRGEAVPNITDSPRYYYCPEFFVGYANETSVTIEGDNTKILGSVYGGGMDGHVRRDASVIIKGGEIGLPFTATNMTLVGATDPDNIQWLARGNVYGAGSGIGKYNDEFCTSAGSVTRFTTVDIQGGTIYRNVYGGGSLASIGAPKIPADRTDNPTKAQTLNTVTISGGQIGGDYSYASGTHVYGGHVFGGSRGDASLRNSSLPFSTSMFTEVNVEAGANIYGSVFGGGEVGIVRGDVAVAINGGTIHDDVYGGGALADTNTETSSTVPYTTTVNLIGGSIDGDAYGGGLGQLEPAIEAIVHGNVHVTLGNETEDETKASATKFNISYLTDNSVAGSPAQVVKSGRVFGCNNLNGSPKGNVTVTVNRTAKVKNGNGDVISRTAITRDATTNEITAVATPHIYEVAAVYGGGNLADYTAAGKKARVEVMTCDVSIEEVYGGGNAAKVPATDVEVKGAHQIERVFGGGNGKDKYTLDGGTSWVVNPGADIDGDAYTIIKGGLIHEAYGGSNEKGTITGNITINTATGGCEGCPTQIDKLVGAGKNADVNGNLIMVLGCYPKTKTPLIFAGADNANVNGDVELTITSGTFGKVFGGNNQGGAIKGHIVLNIEETGCNPIKIDELYLGGNMAAYSVYGYNTDGTCKTSGTTNVYDQPVLNVVSCTSIGKVFGGGYGVGGVMYADPTVNISMIPGAFAGNITETTDNPYKLGAIGDVYGGGNAADVIGNPTVNIGTAATVILHQSYTPAAGYSYSAAQTVKGAYITGNVFGAGMGSDDSFTCEKAMVGIDGDGVDHPTGGTTVNIYNGTVLGNVYGGGEVGRVEKNTLVTIGTGDGVDATQDTPISAPVIKGSVFGGGKGKETHGYSALVRGNPTVIVQGNAKVRGNVYGGGQIASVARYKVAVDDDEGAPYGVKKDEPYALKNNNSGFCSVTIKGYAEIGPETVASDAKTTSVGHVFGAGKGILPGGDYAFVSGTTKRMVSVKNEQGQITGSTWETFANEADYITFIKTLALASQTAVTIDGNAKVKGSVFGGSESGFVQFDTQVNVAGGTIGTTGKGGADFGNVYGGGKGDVEFTGVNNDYIAAGIVKGNTKILVSQASGKTTKVLHNIYGGGAYGTVGEYEYDATSGVPTARKTYNIGTEVHNTTGGKTEVYITGGTIGTNGDENGMVFGSSRGDVGAPGSIHDKAAWVYDTHVAIGDTVATATTTASPLIKGSIYGGGENGHNLHNVYVRINGGTIGIPEGEPIGSYTAGGASYPYRGNVYGGGCGTDKYDNKTKYNPQAGIVRGNVVLNMTAGHVVHNMYGAGAMGSVGKKVVTAGVTTITGGQTTISISGGQLGVDDESDDDGNVFGAARGASDATGDDLAMVYGNANVTLSGGAVYGSVFGGGQRGVTLGSVAVNMTGGSVSKDIYGGGALADTNTGALSNTTTTYKTIVNLLGGTIGGDAYGGGLGQLGAEPVEAKVYGDTKVNLNGLEAGDYAEGIHKPLTEGTTARLVSIVDDNNQVKEYQINDAVQGAVVGRIFGCNNLNGSPQCTVKVHVFKTQRAGQTRITNTSEVTTAKVKVEPTNGEYNLKSFDVEAVYGGGNMAAFEPVDLATGKTQVVIDGCDRTSIGQVYGGGNAASCPATEVTVNASFEIAEVFGGGNGKDRITVNNVEKENPGANVGFYDYSAVEAIYNTKEERQKQAFKDQYVYGTGKAAVNVYGGTIHRVFGGSNTKGNVRQSAITMLEDAEACTFCVDEAYGGGKSAMMDAEAKLLMACIPGLREVYGGAQAADVFDDVSVTVTNGTFDRVFGGNNLSGTIRGKITVNIEETGCRPVIIGELYGGGNKAGYSVYGYKQMKESSAPDAKLVWKPRESATDNTADGEINVPAAQYADPQVNVKSFTSIGTIYGGGYGEEAVMVGNPTVNINVVYGDKKDYEFSALTKTIDGHPVTIPSHKSGAIGAIGNVFGGGNAAKVIGNTNVNVGTAATVSFVSKDDEAHTNVPVVGANIVGNVYGGGNNAEVTGETHVQIGK